MDAVQVEGTWQDLVDLHIWVLSGEEVMRTKILDVVLTYTFCSTDLYAAWSFVQRTTSSAEVTCPLEGVTQIEGALHSECLRKLPESLHKLKFHHSFNQSLQPISFPSCLQSLTFGDDFNQNLEGVTFPSSLQSLTFGDLLS